MSKRIDLVLDTDTYNEVDDQFAIAYMMKSPELNPIAIYAAPFKNRRSASPEEGMLKSYDEILTMLKLLKREDLKEKTFKGSTSFLPDENTPVLSSAALDLITRSKPYSKDNRLNVVAIGAITNVASAILLDHTLEDRIRIIWLGGNEHRCDHNREFNMMQDVAAARICMRSRAEFVQLPACDVTNQFKFSHDELIEHLHNKTELSEYLLKITEDFCRERDPGWTKVLYDVCGIGYLLNENSRFMEWEIRDVLLSNYDHVYEKTPIDKKMVYVTKINNENLKEDMFNKIV